MIPLSGFEKIGVGGKVIKYLLATGPKEIRYPIYTLGLLGAGAATLGIANKVHDLYNITSEMRKRKIMKGQTDLLQQIADNTKNEKDIASVIKQKPVIHPLT